MTSAGRSPVLHTVGTPPISDDWHEQHADAERCDCAPHDSVATADLRAAMATSKSVRGVGENDCHRVGMGGFLPSDGERVNSRWRLRSLRSLFAATSRTSSPAETAIGTAASPAVVASDHDRPSPRRPILSLRLEMSMSFMLASLRVLHIDISSAPAVAGRLSSRLPTHDLSATARSGHCTPADRLAADCPRDGSARAACSRRRFMVN